MSEHEIAVPKDGLAGLKENWRSDLIAAFSVAMVALPLALGIAAASGVPPMAGVLSAALGGIVTTFFRGSHLGINGPTAGLITVILGGTIVLNDGSGNALRYVMAAIVLAGALQTLLGLFKMGKLGELFPSSVIHGVLAAIGIIIFTKQLNNTLGFSFSPQAKSILQQMGEVPFKIFQGNPLVAVIGILGLLFLILYPKINNHFVRFIPAPMWVLLLGVGLVMLFGFQKSFDYSFFGKQYQISPKLLVNLPKNISSIIQFPNFSRIAEPKFWGVVISIMLIASIESLAASKAIDKLDPFKRKTDLNKDLVGIGISTMVSGMIGGLPIITVIVRSSVNLQNQARTRWSNFFHGLILLFFILVLSPVIQLVPLAALGAILVFTGYKLGGPRVFRQTAQHGWEQLLFLGITLAVTLATDMLWGIFAGMGITLAHHFAVSRMNAQEFFSRILRPSVEVYSEKDEHVTVKVFGVANFLGMLSIQKKLEQLPEKRKVILDLAGAQLVDMSVMEFFEDYKRQYNTHGGEFLIVGLQDHYSTTTNPMALHTKPKARIQGSTRQSQMKNMAESCGWSYDHTLEWDSTDLATFHFFQSRPIEFRENVISGEQPELNYQWEMSDVTFDEGAMLATEVYHSTVELVRLPFTIPPFLLEREGRLDKWFDKLMKKLGFVEADFQLYPEFSNKFMLKCSDESSIQKFFTQELVDFLEQHDMYHVESNGEALLIFLERKFATTETIEQMQTFRKKLITHLNPDWAASPA